MVKFYSKEYTYDYAFPAVSLAYFLRYPNPYSRHVASTDTISRHFDPDTQRLTTVRLHLKRSRLPPAVVKLLPKSMMADRAGSDGSTQSFILEKSVVDAKQGWMECESRNLDWENVLSVFERHSYRRAEPVDTTTTSNSTTTTTTAGTDGLNSGATTSVAGFETPAEQTHVAVSVTLKSRIGEQLRKKRQRWGEQASASSVMSGGGEESATAATALGKPQQLQQPQQQQQQGWFSSWGSGAVRSAIESISLQRTEKSQPKAQKGMSVVLSRLRSGGIQEVLEGMRRDREVEI
ncbi:hypothetical protein D0869_11876 [Hortaea werneckii]|uniref:PRELI/MSF1 domain-containing protein n=1 Tax=Hortaea werneckii TaxID=91943 RepID=A0A3M6WA61_HORWE|nr:hypothetical protein KC334_g7439 [Hortaea werneckii]KAI7004717.1 hypothetical protein KC355_g8586 [Hortaea werneckii]KAI7189545.1 hypothetical protein KC324_g6223 [Hortaea werneckii]KAI7595363.1 hypothetical protein KC316_g597 [Hortaea werneckii]KAI7665229.1 hypothetical protein KC318_g7245 [Hortaea werneckii]